MNTSMIYSRLKRFTTCFLLVLNVVLVIAGTAWAETTYELRISLDDTFLVRETRHWSVNVEKQLALRSADVRITPKHGYDFSMMLYFKCDTPDLAQFDTPEKTAETVRRSSQKYLPHTVEKSIELHPAGGTSTYGYLTVLTDRQLADKNAPIQGEYKYMTRGMIRLSKDSALGFSIMTNDVTSGEYKALLDYVFSFVKKTLSADNLSTASISRAQQISLARGAAGDDQQSTSASHSATLNYVVVFSPLQVSVLTAIFLEKHSI